MSAPTWYDHYYQVLEVASGELDEGERFYSRDIADILEKDSGAVGKAIKHVNEEEDAAITVVGRKDNRLQFEYGGGSPPESWTSPFESGQESISFRSRIQKSASRSAVELADVSALDFRFYDIYDDVLGRLSQETEMRETRLKSYLRTHPRLEPYSLPERIRLAGEISRQILEGFEGVELRSDRDTSTYAIV